MRNNSPDGHGLPADVYSFGVILFELAARPTRPEVGMEILIGSPPQPRWRRLLPAPAASGIAALPGYEAAMAAALRPDPGARGSMADKHAALAPLAAAAEAAAAAEVARAAEEATNTATCIICCSEPRSRLFAPCGHMLCCGDCVDRVRARGRCPNCRVPIGEVIRVFL